MVARQTSEALPSHNPSQKPTGRREGPYPTHPKTHRGEGGTIPLVGEGEGADLAHI